MEVLARQVHLVESELPLKAIIEFVGVGDVFDVRSDGYLGCGQPVRRSALQHRAAIVNVRRALIVRLLGVTAAIGLAMAFTVPATDGGPSYGVAAARDIMALIASRSPGERTHGRLSNTKIAKQPHQFAKTAIHAPLPDVPPGVMDAAPRIIDPIVEPETPFSVAGLPAESTAQTLLPPVFVGGSGGGSVALFDGGSSGGSTSSSGGESSSSGGESSSSTSSGGTDNPPPPVVPEPATWLMMIVGIGFVGAMLRRRKISGSLHRDAVQSRASGTDV